jgi:D-aspartate ligase
MDFPNGWVRLTSMAPPALFADATWYGTLAAVRNLGARSVTVTLASDSWIAPARWSRYAARTVSCPSSKDAARFLAWLLRFGADEPGHVLYPTSDEVAWLVAGHSESLSRCFRLYTPPIETLVRLLDKKRLVDDARAVGLDVPETLVPQDASEVEDSSRKLAFPLFVKPRTQMFGRSLRKGTRVEKPVELLPTWLAQRREAKYDAEVLRRIPDLHLPMIQSWTTTERVYTVDGFVDEAGELYTSLACVKLLQRPRGSGPGIIFEHAEIDPAIDLALQRLFRTTGFFGVFDAEFMEYGTRKILIDINPRFYNHMAFEIERGLHLPWLAYLAANHDREALRAEVERAKGTRVLRGAYVHRFPTALLLAAHRLAGGMPEKDQVRWRRWVSAHLRSSTDPARAVDDTTPAVAEVFMEALAFMRHPRSYLRNLWTC